MRFLALVFTFSTMLFASSKVYELQLYASKTDDIKSMNKIINKASKADLECSITHDHIYSFVKCDQNSRWKDILHSAKKAKKANLKYFISKMKNRTKEEIRVEPVMIIESEPKREKISTIKKIENGFFSDNSELLNMLYNQDSNSKLYLQNKKNQYLKNIEEVNSFNGLYFKGRSALNLEEKKLDYNLRIEWNILEDGYLGSKKDAKNAILKKELDYNRLLDEINSANLELSLYKISAINNFIRYQFSKYKETILHNILEKENQKYRASLITSKKLNKLSKEYETIKQTRDYYAQLEHQKYDIKMKNFMQSIEKINLIDKESLAKEAYSNSFLLQRAKNKISQVKNSEKWSDEIKTNLYIENKKHFFLNSTDTIAGVQVQLPLDFNDNKRDEVQKIELEATKVKESVIKKLIFQTIEESYHKISYYKTNISTLQEELKYYQNRANETSIKSKYPLPSQKGDPVSKLANIELSISDVSQKIWEQKTEILRELLKIQYISGVQVLM